MSAGWTRGGSEENGGSKGIPLWYEKGREQGNSLVIFKWGGRTARVMSARSIMAQSSQYLRLVFTKDLRRRSPREGLRVSPMSAPIRTHADQHSTHCDKKMS